MNDNVNPDEVFPDSGDLIVISDNLIAEVETLIKLCTPGREPRGAEETLKKISAFFTPLIDEFTRLTQENEIKPGAEARGVAWCDVYRVVEFPRDNGGTPIRKLMKRSVTARSDIGPRQANDALDQELRRLWENGWRPYQP